MEPVNDSTTVHTDIEQTDAQEVIKHVSNFEAVARYENPDLRDLMAAHALLSLAGALTAAPSVQHDSRGSNAVLEVAASTASGSTAAPVMPIQATSTIISTPATVPVVAALSYCGMYSTVTPSNLSAGPLVQYRTNSLGVASASRHGIHSLVQPTRYHRGTYSTTAPSNLSAGPLVQYRPTISGAAPAPLHGAHAHTRHTSLYRGAYSTVAPSNLGTGPLVQYRPTSSGAASASLHSAYAPTRPTSSLRGAYSIVAPSNLSAGPLVQYRIANSDAASASSRHSAYSHAGPTPAYSGACSTVGPSNLSAGPLVQCRTNSLGVASASRHGIHSLIQPAHYYRRVHPYNTPRNLSAGPLVQYRPTNSGAASASPLNSAYAPTRPTSSLRGAHSTVAPSNLSAGPSVQYRVTNSDATLTSSRHSADAHARSTPAYNGIYIHRTPANVNPGPSVEPHCANTDAAPANPVAGPSVKRRASNPQQPKRQRVNSWEGSAVVVSSGSGEGTSNAGQDVSTIVICDVAGEVVTAALFSRLFKRFFFIGLDMVLVMYLHLVGRELAAASISPRQLKQQLGKLEGFEICAQGFQGVNESFLVRSGPVHQQMRRNLYRCLRIAEEAQAGVVAAPVLYLHVVTIGCIHAKQLVEAAPLEMFKAVTGCDLGSRWIISENGPISFSGTEYCRLAQGWLLVICEYIIKDDRMEALLKTADDCYKAYKKTGRDRGNKGVIFDPDGRIRQEILQSDDLALKLVIGLSYVDMLELYEVLPCMVDGMFDKDESDYLKRVSSFASNQLKLLTEQ
ncbi:hypothetical protein GGI09_000065 [Coemansia sp. S100]|nr:hypothetical protein LPJ71_001264 [Coemansia sp. S17]KAJ2104562.1 hypothetical protein GGI09_000065 [Coemansia sp. S100]KAJ2105415.1 hypothetical protein GGI16_002366 [Coemansia sp. S142-1]